MEVVGEGLDTKELAIVYLTIVELAMVGLEVVGVGLAIVGLNAVGEAIRVSLFFFLCGIVECIEWRQQL